MRALYFVAVVLVWLGTSVPAAVDPAHNIQQANEVWEQAIAAKGGREKLHQVRNLVQTTDNSYYEGLQRKERLYVRFHAFPNKLWAWFDDRPGIFELNIEVYDADNGRQWEFSSRNLVVESSKGPDVEVPASWKVSHPENGTLVERPMPPEDNDRFAFFQLKAQLCYLLETPWVKPVPLKAETVKTELGEVTALHTKVDAYGRRYRVVFFFDPQTHLPLKVGFRDLDGPLPLRDPQDLTSLANYYAWVSLADYVNVDGIQMPSRVGHEERPATSPRSFQMNVAYDEGVFERPPSIEAGPDAWRPKTKR